MDGCIFCMKIRGEAPTDNVFESKNFLVFKDINAKAVGHSLIVPKKHIVSFLEMDSSLYSEFLETAKLAAEKIIGDVEADGFNFLINDGESAGQVVDHLHMHIVPRKSGDGYHLGF